MEFQEQPGGVFWYESPKVRARVRRIDLGGAPVWTWTVAAYGVTVQGTSGDDETACENATMAVDMCRKMR